MTQRSKSAKPRCKFVIEHLPEEDFSNNKVYLIHEGGDSSQRYYKSAHVWMDRKGGGRCCKCSTRINGMSGSCKHVSAVKRFVKKGNSK